MTVGTGTTPDRDVVATLDKAEVRQRAHAFVKAWAGTTSEQSDKQPFWDDFFQVFGVRRRQVATYEAIARRASTGRTGWVDVLLPGQMGIEHKSAGQSLTNAMAQLIDYLPSLPPAEHPWLLVVSDFRSFSWRNLENETSGSFELAELPSNLHLFWWLAGYQVEHREYQDEIAVNLSATELLAQVHDALMTSGYPAAATREWLTRLLFCLFADDADVWDRRSFHSYIALHTSADGHDIGDVIGRVFRVLNTPEINRPQNLDEDLRQFTYINGDLFSHDLWPVTGTRDLRSTLLKACAFDWSAISPAIFGSLFQNVMSPRERRQLGAHYTSERGILRTIEPLFLEEIKSELESASSLPRLRSLHEKIASLTFFDPACGCGNFLVIAYREIRQLETECLRRIASKERNTGQRAVSLDLLCRVRVDQFFGIELEEFPARIARTALYLIDHLENRRVSLEFGEHFVRFPIPASPNIMVGNALRERWDDLLPASQCSYLFGNPPFAGQKTRAADQTADLRAVWGPGFARWLDYVTGWYQVAGEYLKGTSGAKAAFVSTNSVAQGEQVARVWRGLLADGLGIDFAHQTFAWTSEARGRAVVHVVIIGFSYTTDERKRHTLFSYPDGGGGPIAQQVARINPYLLDAPDVLVESKAEPRSPELPPVQYGNKPSDGGHLIVEPEDLPSLGDAAHAIIRPFLGAHDLLHGGTRFCIWMEEPSGELVARSEWLRRRLEAVRRFREESSAPDTQRTADVPWRFFRTPQPAGPYIAIPRHVSQARRWFTVGYQEQSVIASDALFTVSDPEGFIFPILSSGMFMAWLRTIGGRIKSDLRFSGPMVYNTFPLPRINDAQRERVIRAGAQLSVARAAHAEKTLAELYDPLAMPPLILAAHKAIDLAVDRVFTNRGRPSTTTDRMRLLFEAYQATGLATSEQ